MRKTHLSRLGGLCLSILATVSCGYNSFTVLSENPHDSSDETDSTSQSDTEIFWDSDTPNDSDSETDSETDSEFSCTGSGVWMDETSGLCWVKNPPLLLTYAQATKHCDEATAGGYNDWRLPDIEELRSLVRNCPASEWDIPSGTGGSCPAKEGCDSTCYSERTCGGCSFDSICAWPATFGITCIWSWSSSRFDGENKQWAWCIFFKSALVDYCPLEDAIAARCVRG